MTKTEGKKEKVRKSNCNTISQHILLFCIHICRVNGSSVSAACGFSLKPKCSDLLLYVYGNITLCHLH